MKFVEITALLLTTAKLLRISEYESPLFWCIEKNLNNW